MITEERKESLLYETISEKNSVRVTVGELQLIVKQTDENEVTITLVDGNINIQPKYSNQIELRKQ